jgi:hypothetical protein
MMGVIMKAKVFMKCHIHYLLVGCGTIFNPKGMTIQTNDPQSIMKAVLYMT